MRSNDSLKVIVVGIPKTLDDAALQDLFGAYGSVADAKVVRDAATDASRGFGFVTFTAQAAMRRAVKEMDKKQLEGRTLNVRQLVAKDQFQKKDDAKAADMAKRPCYLLRKGKCTKGDRCPFSHEIKSGEFGSCFEYVQNGFCKRGDSCKFFHPPPPPEEGDEEEEEEEEAGSATVKPTPKAAEPVAKKTESKSVEKKDVKKEARAATGDEKKPKEAKAPKDDKPRYCFAYQTGRCHRGKRCLFLHQKLVVPENEAPPAAAAPLEKKRAGDFEVVMSEEPSKKRQRQESDDEETETDGEVEGEPHTKPAAANPTKAKLVEKKPAEKKPSEKKEKKAKATQETDAPVKKETPTIGEDGKPIHTGPKPICRHFLKGLCKRGHICFFRHEQPTPEELAAMGPIKTKGKAKANADHEADEEVEEDATPLQAVADHVASFMANFSAAAPFVPGAPVVEETAIKAETVKTEAETSPAQAVKRKASFDHADTTDAPPAFKRQRPVKKEKVDMGAAFDGTGDSDDDRGTKGRGPRKAKPTKEQMKANREKLREERRAKKTNKKLARDRLKTEGEIEFTA